MNETSRLYGVLNKRLADRAFITGKHYSIADMASYPWIIPQNQSQDMNDFPHLARWHAAIKARPATTRAYARAKQVRPDPPTAMSAAQWKILFGQDKNSVK